MIKRKTSWLAITLVVLACTGWAATVGAQDGRKYYRYVNEDGVKVINSTIPPKYVKDGYEIVSLGGEVLEVVPPAPSEEEKAAHREKLQREAELKEWDTHLLRRYSSVADIEKAKQRKIEDFAASLSILRGNASSIKAQIQDLQGRAANMERQGRPVSEVTLDTLATLKEELGETERLIEKRLEDQQAMEAEFDKDIERFKVIRPQTQRLATPESED